MNYDSTAQVLRSVHPWLPGTALAARPGLAEQVAQLVEQYDRQAAARRRKILVRRTRTGWWCVGSTLGSGTMFRPGQFELALTYALRASGASSNPLNLDPWGRPPGPPTLTSGSQTD